MALSYQTNTVNGSAALLTAIGSFVVGLGGTLFDSISSTDKVYSIVSAVTGRTQYWRFTTTSDAGNPVKIGKERTRDGVIAREYASWNAGTHAGTLRAGRAGPFMYGSPNGAGSAHQALRLNEDFTKWPATTPLNWATGINSAANGFAGFVGTRLGWYVINTTQFMFQDLNTGETWTSAACPGSINTNQQQYVVHSDGTEHIYALSTIGIFYRYSLALNTWTALAATPWNTTSGGGFVIWDGADTIYVAQGNSTTTWAKYSIAGNSWTTLAVLPILRAASYGSNPTFVYIPASASGQSSDLIVGVIEYNTTNFRQYNVTAGTWSVSTAPITFGLAGGAFIGSVIFDDSRYIYLQEPASTGVYAIDVQTLPTPTFTNLGAIYTAVARADVHYPFTGVVYTSISASSTYYFLGDTETLIVACSEGGRDALFTIGAYNSFQNTATMVTTGGVSAGYSTSIPVNDSSKYAVGATVSVINADGSNWETTTILSIPDGTHVVANLTLAHTTGALIGQDVLPYTVAGSIGWASTHLDGKGYLTDGINATWRCLPLFGLQALANTAPGADSIYQLSPMLISGPPFSGAIANANTVNGYAVMNGSGSHQLNKGALRYVYAFGTANSALAPVSGQQILGNDGKNYICLRPNSEFSFPAGSLANHGIAIGPIN
jgi:hypothetical protein